MKKPTFLIIIISILCMRIALAEMDWENMIIKLSATDEAACVDLLKDELYSLQYDNSKTVSDFIKANSDLESRLRGVLCEYHNVKQNYLTDGSIEYIYQLPVKNKIMSLLLPDAKSVKLVVPMLCPSCDQEWPDDKLVPAGLELAPKQIESTEYTGIVIDCRAFKLNPCLFPNLYNELLEEVYSVNFADFNHVIDRGLMLYTTKDLYSDSRVGNNPLRIQAIGTVGDKLTDIKISSFDARHIHGSKRNIELLKECRVAIIFTP